jgi:signal transduction histidine kinase/CheY-like chemotaxis protein
LKVETEFSAAGAGPGAGAGRHHAIAALVDLLVPRFGDGCVIHLVNADGGRLQHVAEHARDPALLASIRATRARPPAAVVEQAFRAGRTERRVAERLDEILHVEAPGSLEEIVAALVVPIRDGERVIGAATIVTADARMLEDASVVERLASLAGAAIAAAQAFEEQQRAGERIERLQRVTEALASMLSIARVAEIVVEHVMEAFSASRGMILLLDRTGTALELLRASPGEETGLLKRHALSEASPMAEAVRERVPLFIEAGADVARRYRALVEAGVLQSGAAIALPLIARGRIIGALALGFDEDREVRRAERDFAVALAHQCSLSLDRCLVFREEIAARARTASLQRVTAALANCRTLDEVSARLVESVTDALRCPAAWLAVLSDDGTQASIVHTIGGDDEDDWRWRQFPVEAPGPVHDVVEARAPLLFPDRRAYQAAYPDLERTTGDEDYEAAAVVPIIGGDRVLAVLGLRFRVPSSFDNDLRELLRAIAAESAHALERALLSEAERSARENLTFLLEASRVLSSSLDAEATLEHLGQLVVPRLADWCSIERLDRGIGPEGTTQARVFLHRNPDKIALGRELHRRCPPRPEGAVARVLRTGRSEARYVVEEGDLPGTLLGPQATEHARGIKELGLRSCLVVPLVAGGTVYGAMTLAICDGEWRYGPPDLALAEEIGARAAVAMANARKHEELLRAREEAERANRTKDEFLAMLGHELRNPLMPILTVVELVRLQGEQGNKKEWSVVERQGRHLLRLVDDLLDVARIARGKVKLRRRPVEAGSLVARALETASTELEARRHRVTIDVGPEGLLVDGDEDRLVQVLANLLNNAARYTEPGGNVEIRAMEEHGWIVVRVRDTGAGLSEHLRARIFDSFVQGPRALDRSQGGLGLGLAIVKNIVELHGGEVGVTSPGVGLGSEFYVRLPKADPIRAAQEALEASEPSPASRRKKRVLVVDDNVDAAETLADALRVHGHEVRVVYDGPAALAAVQSFKPGVALLDIGLPVMDGYELAGELREILGSRALLVAVTGYGQPSDVERARAAGFHHHFTKPVDLPALCALIEEGSAPSRIPAELRAR